MRLFVITILLAAVSFSALANNKISKKEKSQVISLLDKQIEAWNQGNLEKFMETYWKSEKLVFVGSRGPTYGWQATLDNYKKGYPDKAAMGKLEFKILDIYKIDTKTVFVIGRFELAREADNLAGHFTLVLQKIEGKWLIISDHSSSEN
ncbi:MAG: nuclear transport factor 2 family protein [Bacteroidota bacterium]